jgi:DNA-binding transcriptional MerR regulator
MESSPEPSGLVAGMTDSYTSSQVSERTSLTPRQLQWWDEQGIVVPARQGHRRLYSAKDLAELAILSDLRRRGFSLQRIRKMIDLLRHEFGHRLAELLSRGPGLHLLTDGESIFLCDSERGVIDLLRDTQQPLLAICIGPMLERVLAPAPAAGAPAPAAGSEALPAAYPSPELSLNPVISQAPKKASQPVRAATAARAKVRP